MERIYLERCLSAGMSLQAIGTELGCHPSTVALWLRKYGLKAANSDRFAPKGGLDRARLLDLVDEGLSLREIAERLSRSVSTIVKWMNHYGLQTKRAKVRALPDSERPDRIERECSTHGLTTYVRSGSGGHHRCLRCRSERVAARRRRVKEILVGELGGACQLCGYDRWIGALQFHHVDPSQKEFHIAFGGIARSLERARAEARKCVLLCANCHAEVEGGAATVPLTFAPRGS